MRVALYKAASTAAGQCKVSFSNCHLILLYQIVFHFLCLNWNEINYLNLNLNLRYTFLPSLK